MSAEKRGTVAVVGASARAAAFSLLRAGYQVVAADLFADADLARCCPVTRITSYPENLTSWLAHTDSDHWLYTGALENHPELVDRLAQLCPLLGNSGENLRRVRDPLYLQKVLCKADFRFPETVVASDALPSGGRWLGKTYQGSSGNGVGLTKDVPYYQQHVPGVPLSAVFCDDELCGVTRQLVGEAWTGTAEYQYCGTIVPWPLSIECERQLLRLGKLLCGEFHLVGWYGVDLIYADQQLWIIEVNPRYTAAVEVVEQALDAQDDFFGKVILFAKRPVTIDDKLSGALLNNAGGLPWPKLADIPTAGSEIAIGQPILTAFAAADSQHSVTRALQQRTKQLEQQLYAGVPAC